MVATPKYIDKNHGGTLIIFDRWFGTFQKEEEEVVYGVTKALSSWNPLWANLDYYADLKTDWNKMENWKDRFQLLFQKPGWLPASLGGYRSPPAVARKRHDSLQNFGSSKDEYLSICPVSVHHGYRKLFPIWLPTDEPFYPTDFHFLDIFKHCQRRCTS